MKKTCRVLMFAGAFAAVTPSVALATEYTYSVSDASELATALTEINGTTASRDTYVVTLAEGTYDLSEITAMHTVGLLMVTNGLWRYANLTIQGDPAVTRDKVVIDAKQLGRALQIYWDNGDLTIRNLTFVNGKANGNGGAVRVERFCTTVVTNCAFICNEGNGRGGALYGNNDTHMFDCTFLTNRLVGGSGGGAGAASVKEVVGCTFIGNHNIGDNMYGGALRDPTTCVDSTFTDNCATGRWGFAGAVYLSSGTVSNCTFTGNYTGGTSQHGGAVYAASSAKIFDCAFTANHAQDGNCGGAVYMTNHNAMVMNCCFTSNYVNGSNGRGGGFYGIYPMVSNCTFVGNRAYRGGGVNSCTNVHDCVFAGNRSTINSGEEGGGAAYNATLYGCTVTNNIGRYKNGGFYKCTVYDSIVGCNHSDGNYNTRVQDSEQTYFSRCTLLGGLDDIKTNYWHFKDCAFNQCQFRDYSAIHALFVGNVCVTNSLFVSNKVARIFYSASVTNGFVNNTLADNSYNNFATGAGANSSIQVMNCLFTGTARYSGTDAPDDVGNLIATDVYSNNFINTKLAITGGGNLNAYKDASLVPKLMGARDPEHPYAPRYRSPLVGAGLAMDWMAGAVDLAGNPRLTAGKVSIGAYETTEAPKGAVMVLR